MNRRQQIKLENAKIFARKYIFSGRYIVRNTLAVMGLATLAGGAYLTVQVAGTGVASGMAVNTKAEQVEETEAEPEVETYAIQIGEDSLVKADSVDALYVRLEGEDVLTVSNDVDRLTKPEYDMTGKFIVTTEGLNVRAEASEDGNILKVLNTGDYGDVVGTEGEWTIVAHLDTEGYVKTEYIVTDDEATKVAEKAASDGVSYREALGVKEVLVADANNQEQATTEVAIDRKVEIDTTEVAKEDTTKTGSTETTTQAPAQVTTEAPTQAATEAPTQAPTEAPTQAPTEAPTEAPTQAPTEATAVASSDLYLLAAIVYAESGGECYEGQLAVASVVMNRLYSGQWGGSLSSVIYAPSQFSGAYTSAFQTALSTGGSSTSLQAAQDALNGANNIGGYMSFRPTWNTPQSVYD